MCKLITLGVKGGPRITKNGCNPTSTLLDVNGTPYLIDCGLGVTRQMVEAGYELSKLNTIIITHYHSDHTLELGNLLHTAWCSNLTHPVDIYGPVGLKDMMDGFFQFQKHDIAIRIEDEGLTPLQDLIRLHEFSFPRGKEGVIFENESMRASGIKNIHPPFEETYALKFTVNELGKEKIICLSGDTTYYPMLIDFFKDADLLLHEVLLQDGLDIIVERLKDSKPKLREHLVAAHTFAEDVGKMAMQAQVKRLALYHYVPCDLNDRWINADYVTQEIRKHWQGDLILPQDGDGIDI